MHIGQKIDIQQIDQALEQGNYHGFPGGVHPADEKALSNQTPITRLAVPNTLYIPLGQHIGQHGELLVEKGEQVLRGQALTKATTTWQVPVHASTSGTIVDIIEHVSAHPSGIKEQTLVLASDGLDQWSLMPSYPDYRQASAQTLIKHIHQAGIAGMGGAGFPSHIKTNVGNDCECLIINGVECEPYITADDRLMREYADEIIAGTEILSHILQPKLVIIALEDNKPEALQALQSAIANSALACRLVSLPTKYPQGGEKQLIQALTGLEVPYKGLPSDIGCVMFNVATCYAIQAAVLQGKALTERIVTLTGRALDAPQNAWVRLGTPLADCLVAAAYDADKQAAATIIMGGPMMGFTVHHPLVPVIKTTNCLLLPSAAEQGRPKQEQACIRCGMCTDACPAGLLPQQLYWYSKSNDYVKAEEYNIDACIECGACAYVCPSEIPLVQYYRQTKAAIKAEQQQKQAAEQARIRFEARQARLERDRLAREAKAKEAAERRQQAMQNDDGDAKAKIAAALARAKAKRAAQVAPAPAADKPENES